MFYGGTGEANDSGHHSRVRLCSGVSLWLLTRIDEWKTHGEIEKED
jgi:hypothetical protein